MTATNHALTGAFIGLMVQRPIIALPAALLSHFICDGIPHFGVKDPLLLEKTWFSRLLLSDASLCVLLVAVLAYNHPFHWVIASLCAFVATTPDLMWVKKYLRARQRRPAVTERSLLLRFHSRIQWFERPVGGLVEAAWFIGLGSLIIGILKG